MIGSTRKKSLNARNAKSSISGLWLAACVTAVLTPRLPADITLVDRLSDARARAHANFVYDNPLPHIQTNFLPAHLSNAAQAQPPPEGGIADAHCTSNSEIIADGSMGTLQVTGDGMAQAHSAGPLADAEATAKLIVLSFTLTDFSYHYSLTGQLSAFGGCLSACAAATAKLAAESSTIFEIAADGVAPPVTLSETGTLSPGTYTLSVDLSDLVDYPFPQDQFGTSVANFNFTLDPAPTPTPTPPSPAQALNLSTRLLVQSGDGAGIGGFIITGSAPKQVLLRGIGPSLGSAGVPNPLADPILELHGPPGFPTVVNDNGIDWCTSGLPQIPPCFSPGAIGLPPTNGLDSFIGLTLDPGAYTVILRGHENAPTGVGLVELYDLGHADSRLANLSTRAFVGTGNEIVIAGFILGGGSSNDLVVIRGLGPSLGALGLSSVLADPTLELRNSHGAVVASNNNWQDDPAFAQLIAFHLAPTSALESGIVAALSPGAYTALLSGVNDGTGLGLVEVYDLGSP